MSSFSMSLTGHELIQDCSIELTVGRRYGLIGQNGSGKTNFLCCLANREVSSLWAQSSDRGDGSGTAGGKTKGQAEHTSSLAGRQEGSRWHG